MKNKFVFLAVLVISALLFSACGGSENEEGVVVDEGELANLTEEGLPITKEKVTLEFFAGKPPQSADNWNDVLVWNEYEEMSNVEVKWETVSTDSLDEKRNLVLGGGDLPDAFYSAGLSPTDVLKYGEQGVFIPLNDLIDEHAPNLKKLLEENPEIEQAITYPDGNIYSLPTIFDKDFASMRLGPRPWIDKDTLEALGMDMPETTEEYYEFLKAVKEEADQIPFGSYSISMFLRWVNGSFGLVNRGFSHQYVDMGQDGEMRFIPTSDEYKEMLEYVHKLYSEGLIEESIFQEGGTTEQFLANATEGKYASTVSHDPSELFNIDTMVNAPALEGPFGDKLMTGVTSVVTSLGDFVITSENEYPVTTIKWADNFFDEEIAKFFFMGVEGETYEEDEDGNIKYVDKITNSEDGTTFEQQLAKYLVWPGGAYASTIIKEDYFHGLETSEASLESAENLSPYMIDEVWPAFTHTEEENKVLSTTGVDIEKYVQEMRDKFIEGRVSFEEWDDYVDTIEKMGLEEYMDVKRKALERLEDN